eukprot:scaffold242380_cov26-Tisochrysis_lutea.AAC.2
MARTNWAFFLSALMSYSSCAFSPRTYGSSGVCANRFSTCTSRACLSAMVPVGTMVYAAMAGWRLTARMAPATSERSTAARETARAEGSGMPMATASNA